MGGGDGAGTANGRLCAGDTVGQSMAGVAAARRVLIYCRYENENIKTVGR